MNDSPNPSPELSDNEMVREKKNMISHITISIFAGKTIIIFLFT